MESKASILVVDDEEGLSYSIMQYLSRFGFATEMKTNGEAAVEYYKANHPDIMLIDVLLGENSIDGIEVLKRIKEVDANALCVMTTRITDEKTVKKAKELGALHYVLKPLSGDDIVEIANEAAEIIQQRRTGNV